MGTLAGVSQWQCRVELVARFVKGYQRWAAGRCTQRQVAQDIGFSERTFRRWKVAYEDGGVEALPDKRNTKPHNRARDYEIDALISLYVKEYSGWSGSHFFDHYRHIHNGQRSYSWVVKQLQAASLLKRLGRGKSASRPRFRQRERSAQGGILAHLNGWKFRWNGADEWALVTLVDDATGIVPAAFFVGRYDTSARLRAVRDTIHGQGFFGHLTCDTQLCSHFAHVLKQLGIRTSRRSSSARGFCARMCRYHQDRLTKELVHAGIAEMMTANAYLVAYCRRFNDGLGLTDGVGRYQALTERWDLKLRDMWCEWGVAFE